MKKTLSILLSLCMLLSITAGLNLNAYAADTLYDNSIIASNTEKVRAYVRENGVPDEDNNPTVKYTKTMSSIVDNEEQLQDCHAFISALNDGSLLLKMKFYYDYEVIYCEMTVPSTAVNTYRLYARMGVFDESSELYYVGAYADINADYEVDSLSASYTCDIDEYDIELDNETYNVLGELGLVMWSITLDDLLGLNLGAVGFHSYCIEHDNKAETEKPSNCKEYGIEKSTCQICGLVNRAAIESLGDHIWDNGVVTKAPSCTEKGVKTFTCTVDNCGETKTEAIAMTAHSYKNVVTKATLTKNGKVVPTCSCGATKAATTISYPKTITLAQTSYIYDGKVKAPKVTVKGADGKTIAASNYTVSYASGRKAVGKYAVKITFKGNYSGTKTLYFTINPKGTTIASIAPASKAMTVKWKKQATQTTGYQIQYATNAKFTKATTVTVAKNSTVSKKITKLTGKKKYYVRVRTYKTVGKTKYYSTWSPVKNVTTKK